MSTRAFVLVGAALAVGATSAQADFIREVGSGSFVVTSDDGFTREMSHDLVVISEVGGWGIMTITADTVQTFQAGSDLFSGTATFHGATNDDFITVSMDGVLDSQDGQANFSFSGLWETTATGGDYADLTGSGDFSGSGYFTDGDSGIMDMIFQGDLIPAPTTASLLAIGGLLASRRRR